MTALDSPNLPWRLSGIPQLFEVTLVTKCVHCMPKPGMPVDCQLTVGRKLHEWFAFERGLVAIDIVEHLWREHHKTTVDPVAVHLRFLAKAAHQPVLVYVENAKAPGRLH